jgi:hypothetical protein
MSVQETGPMPAPEYETVAAFIRRLQRNGVQLSVTGAPGRVRLWVRAPPGRVSPDDRQRLVRWRDVIIALLGEGAGAGAGAGAGGDAAAAADIGEASDVNAPCPRCAALAAQVAEVMEQLRASPALLPALRALPPEKLAILLKWSILAATNPRPAWPPPRPTEARRKHRRPLDAVVEDLGGHACGGEPPPPDPEELSDDASPAD